VFANAVRQRREIAEGKGARETDAGRIDGPAISQANADRPRKTPTNHNSAPRAFEGRGGEGVAEAPPAEGRGTARAGKERSLIGPCLLAFEPFVG